MADVTPSSPAVGGTTITKTTAATATAVVNTKGNAVLVVENGSGGSINVTLAAGASPNRGASDGFPPSTLAAQVVAVGAGATGTIQLYPAFNDGSGKVGLTFSSTTSVNVWAIQPN